MSRESQLVAGAPTGKLPAVAVCACADDVHRWSAPVIEVVDTARITRWRCTCPHCRCDGLHLTVDPARQDTTDHTCSAVVPVGSVRTLVAAVPRKRTERWAESEADPIAYGSRCGRAWWRAH